MPTGVDVLLLTTELDFATDRVCLQLAERGVRYLRLNREQLPQVGLTLSPTIPQLTCTHDGTTWVIGNGLRAVWWRLGTFDRRSTPDASAHQQMVETQWPAFVRSLMAFDGATWFNDPARTYRAEVKAVQLREAARLGLNAPATLMTNDPQAPGRDDLGPHLALKSVDTLLLREGGDQLFGYTTMTEWDAISRPELKAAPVTAQRAIMEKLDIRTTVLGERSWSVAVVSDGRGIEGDWRLTPKAELAYLHHDLPPELEGRCRELVQALGLRYGAIDLALDGQGSYWFLEINPTGEWGWLDGPDRPLAAAIAQKLADC